MKRKLSIFLCMILAAALFTALSGSVLAAGTDISATVGNRVALRLDTASDAVLTGASVVEGELPEGLQVSASGGKLLLSGTPVKAGYHRAVVRPVPGGYADEQILRINVRPGEMEPARGEELFNGTTETVPETTAAPDPTAAPAPAGPKITKHPGGETISANGSAIFVARAEDVAEYTWYIVAPRGVAYLSDQVKTVFPDMGIAGEKGNGIILYNIPAEFNGWQVECHFKDAQGNESISDRATVTVSATMPAAPNIVTPPKGAYLMFGEKTTLSVYAEAPTGYSIKYQWFATEEDNPATATAIPDATGAEYAPPEKAGTVYYCVSVRSISGETISTVAYSPLVAVTYSNEPEVPAHVHEYSEEWEHDDVYHWHVCTGCGETADKATHSYTWTETVKPTSRKQGERVGVCSVCGYQTTQTVPAQSNSGGKPGKGLLVALLILVIVLLLLGAYKYILGGTLPGIGGGITPWKGGDRGDRGGRHSGSRSRRE